LIIVVGGIVVEFGIAITLFPTFGVLVYVVVVTSFIMCGGGLLGVGRWKFFGRDPKTWSAFP
jgi:hypothetical protein